MIGFLHYRQPCENVLMVGQDQIERVTSHKLLCVYLSYDLLWNTHIEYIVKEAEKRLHISRVSWKTGVGLSELVTVYVSVIRAISECAAPVWSAIQDNLNIKLERVQKKAVRIVNPDASYKDSLNRTGLENLFKRRDNICKKFAKDNKQSGPLKHIFKIRKIASVTTII